MKPKAMPIHITAEALNPTHLRANTGSHAIEFDKSPAHGGTNLGPSPIHTFVATLNGCTYVVIGILAKELGIKVDNVKIDTTTDFNPSQLMNLSDDMPLEEIVVSVSMNTDATPEQIEEMKHGVEARCPVAVIMKAAGISLVEKWDVSPLGDTKVEL